MRCDPVDQELLETAASEESDLGSRTRPAKEWIQSSSRRRKIARTEPARPVHDGRLLHVITFPMLVAQFLFLLVTLLAYGGWGMSNSGFTQRSLLSFAPLAAWVGAAGAASLMYWLSQVRQGIPSGIALHLFAAFMGVTCALFAGEIDLRDPASDGLLLAGLLLVGTSTFMTSPIASTIYVVAAAATFLVVTPGGSEVAAVVCALCAAWTFASAALHRRVFARQELRMGELEERARTSEELISGFEEGGNHWLWEIDAAHRFKYASPRLASLLERDPQSVIGEDMWEVLACYATSGGKQSPLHTLQFYISARLPFQDVVLPLAVAEAERWFSISGGPLVDSKGQFAGYCGVGTDLTSTRQAEEQARKLASFDSLTGLANRAHFTEILENLLKRSRGRHSPCTLMFIDLDRFKMVNDTLGHPVGDELLREVARRIEFVVKSQGRAGRIGGDEFVVALQDSPKRATVEKLAGRLIAELSAPYHIGRSKIQIGASIGLATAPEHGLTSADLIRHADLALYRSKEAGRGKYNFYEASLGEIAENRRSLEVDLREALARDQLGLEYQPIFELESGKVVGFEALLRWTHPSRALISPEEFVPIAEECGLIVQVGDWVLRTALSAAAEWPTTVKIAVNLSPIQLQDPGLSVSVMNALAKSQIAPERVELEITESVFLQETPTTHENLRRLEGLGVRFALDDFGTGYSSLGYLRRGLFTKIKIDRSFVQGVDVRNSGNRSIVKAVIALANSLGMTSTAEGAETERQINALKELGCMQVQGFAAGKPLDAASARSLVHNMKGVIGERVFEPRPLRLAMLKRIKLDVNGRSLKGVLRNISPDGAMIKAEESLALGAKARLELPSIGCPIGVVRWTQGNSAGLEFESQVELEPLSEFARNEGSRKARDGPSSSVASEAA
jgi:diguanylate cyclase (GGDEF)-like protein